ncbi:hypothetical protein SCHPADRAFT_906298 [Schizopora paradoxa]|uniref:Uncharacterized protein n=1 Tax=Schizopora paradoxa TaxID=27342 RepID=A0A0H2RGZ4_9AGAM|nr:hypothetical protein SCHPADRAFT_906298 [Schizopora paradoxa]
MAPHPFSPRALGRSRISLTQPCLSLKSNVEHVATHPASQDASDHDVRHANRPTNMPTPAYYTCSTKSAAKNATRRPLANRIGSFWDVSSLRRRGGARAGAS